MQVTPDAGSLGFYIVSDDELERWVAAYVGKGDQGQPELPRRGRALDCAWQHVIEHFMGHWRFWLQRA